MHQLQRQKISSQSITMILRSKHTSKRKDTHSRQHNSNIRSTSRSQDRPKQRSQSKTTLKLKNQQNRMEEGVGGGCGHVIGTRVKLKKSKSGKEVESSNQYYSHFRGKSKSRGKLQMELDEPSKMKYMNSVYMHKDGSNPTSTSQMQHINQAEQIKNTVAKEQIVSSNAILSKFKMLQRHCGMDINGKIMPKEVIRAQYYQNSKNTDSQNTISMFEGEKKKEKKKGRDKNRKDLLRGAKSKREERGSEIGKISMVKSSEKGMKKREFKDKMSPNFMEKYVEGELRHGIQSKTKIESIRPVPSSKTSKTLTLEQTRTSPNQDLDSPEYKSRKFTYQHTLKEIEQQSTIKFNWQKLKLIYGSELLAERTRCIDFISKICLNFSIRRQAHSLAIQYMDKYILIIQKDISNKQLKLIAMTALLLALKMDDGIMSRKVCHEYINKMQSLLESVRKDDGRGRSMQKNRQLGSGCSSNQSSGRMVKSKQSSTSELGVVLESKKNKKRQIHHSKQMQMILAIQLDMMIKFKFKLATRSTTYWIDLLTSLWDGYISDEMSWSQEKYFRYQRNKRNLSHLYQIMETMSLMIQTYRFSKVHLVLSSMYLIIRMKLEEQKEHNGEIKIYQKYIQNFNKSTNLIFYDKLGVNELFGHFLEELQLNISHLVDCIRYVGRNMQKQMKVFGFIGKNKYNQNRNYEHQLSIYQGNDQFFKEKRVNPLQL